jgi:hypothetical protein
MGIACSTNELRKNINALGFWWQSEKERDD